MTLYKYVWNLIKKLFSKNEDQKTTHTICSRNIAAKKMREGEIFYDSHEKNRVIISDIQYVNDASEFDYVVTFVPLYSGGFSDFNLHSSKICGRIREIHRNKNA